MTCGSRCTLNSNSQTLRTLPAESSLIIRIMAQIFEQSQILPPLWSNGLIASAGNQSKAVYRKTEFQLFDQAIIRAGKSLLADLASRCVGEDIVFECGGECHRRWRPSGPCNVNLLVRVECPNDEFFHMVLMSLPGGAGTDKALLPPSHPVILPRP